MYKIIHNSAVIDAVRNPSFIRFLPFGHIAMTDKSSAQGIVGSDGYTVYSFSTVDRPNTPVVSIERITEEELSRLVSLLSSGQKISADESELARAKQQKVQQLSATCKTKIMSGFTVILQDGNKYDFKLTAEDQLNLLNLENQLIAGAETFIYHATGCSCQIFMREDMTKIIRAFRQHTLYHTTYFNAAKHYINSQIDLDKVQSFVYGTPLADTVEDLVLKQILRQGGTV